jgi:hypothetical protein
MNETKIRMMLSAAINLKPEWKKEKSTEQLVDLLITEYEGTKKRLKEITEIAKLSDSIRKLFPEWKLKNQFYNRYMQNILEERKMLLLEMKLDTAPSDYELE